MRSPAIAKLMPAGAIDRSLFDQQDIAEIVWPELPGERLVVCFNPLLAEDRRRTRAGSRRAADATVAAERIGARRSA